jgi:hypothetical protein
MYMYMHKNMYTLNVSKPTHIFFVVFNGGCDGIHVHVLKIVLYMNKDRTFISHKFIDSPIKGPQGAYTYTISELQIIFKSKG